MALLVLFPGHCSLVISKRKCILPPEYILEINDDRKNKFMIGLSCLEHKKILEEKFLVLQREKFIPQGKILFIPIKKVYTNCIIGNQDDIDEIKLKRYDN
jgi:hypothetical protein